MAASRIRSGFLLGLLTVQAGLLTCLAVKQSVTVDEAPHMLAGLTYWQSGSFSFYSVNPPLSRLVATALLCHQADAADGEHYVTSSRGSVRGEFNAGWAFFESHAPASHRFLVMARITQILFSFVGTVICYRWGTELSNGGSTGIIAASLWVLCPNVLGHGSLLTADVPGAATGLLAIYGLRHLAAKKSVQTAATFGIFSALAITTKLTWIVVLPVVVIVVEAVARVTERFSRFRIGIKYHAVSAGVAWLVVCSVYGFEGVGVRIGDVPFYSHLLRPEVVASEVPSEGLGFVVPEQRRNRFSDTLIGAIPSPLPTALLRGLDLQKRDFEKPYPFESYLLGSWQKPGWYYFYPVAAFFKLTPAFILIGVLSLGRGWFWLKCAGCFKEQDGRANLDLALLVLGATFACFAVLICSQKGMSVHFRYAIPLIPVVALIVSSLLTASGIQSLYARWAIVLTAFHGVCSICAFPNQLAYTNVFAMGRGHEIVTDSNIDWGQDMWQLFDWQRRGAAGTPWFFAGHDFVRPEIFGLQSLPAAPYVPHMPSIKLPDGRRGPAVGLHVVSKWKLVGGGRTKVFAGGVRIGGFEYYSEFAPVGKIGESMYIYDISVEDLNAFLERHPDCLELDSKPH